LPVLGHAVLGLAGLAVRWQRAMERLGHLILLVSRHPGLLVIGS
jgi:hypothetical protein